MVTDKMVEAAAKAMFEHGDHGAWGDRDTEFWKGYAFAALEAALSASDTKPVCTVAEIGAGGYRMLAPYPLDAINHLPVGAPLYAAPPAVAVKALEWVDVSYGGIAHTPFGMYQARFNMHGRDTRQYEMIPAGGTLPVSFHDSLEEAKAAAQADHEARVRSELVSPADTSPVIPEGWQLVPKVATAEMEDAAKRFVRPYHDIQPSDWTSMVPKDFFRLAWKAMLASAPKEASHDD